MKIPFLSWGSKPVTTPEVPKEPLPASKDEKTDVSALRSAPRPFTPVIALAPPAPPEVHAMEEMLSRLAYRVGETLAKNELYFPVADLAILGVPTDSAELAAEADGMARGLLLRAEIRHGERYVTYGAELDAAIRSAQSAARLFRLLSEDSINAAALPLLRRVVDAADRVIVRAAKLLSAPVSEAYERGGALVTAQSELETACYKAAALLRRRPALLPEMGERMTRAATWEIAVAAQQTAMVALEARGLVLPASEKPKQAPLNGLKALPDPRATARRSAFASIPA